MDLPLIPKKRVAVVDSAALAAERVRRLLLRASLTTGRRRQGRLPLASPDPAAGPRLRHRPTSAQLGTPSSVRQVPQRVMSLLSAHTVLPAVHEHTPLGNEESVTWAPVLVCPCSGSPKQARLCVYAAVIATPSSPVR